MWGAGGAVTFTIFWHGVVNPRGAVARPSSLCSRPTYTRCACNMTQACGLCSRHVHEVSCRANVAKCRERLCCQEHSVPCNSQEPVAVEPVEPDV